ncbi:MAG: hypothetical protein UT20_C0054G0005 [Candidatus Levybacteria bacterium GW2011_GWA1_39_11]|nr:MAG: hypothetical protein UT20_C0054G0005 [Candidatus Levybacteria bacterium GW2011_GWA1_39_11]
MAFSKPFSRPASGNAQIPSWRLSNRILCFRHNYLHRKNQTQKRSLYLEIANIKFCAPPTESTGRE